MSAIYKGHIIDTDLSRAAMGGTEQMRQRLIDNVDSTLLENVAIHCSRVRTFYDNVPNIFWAHDLVNDSENDVLKNGGWAKFDAFVFVTCWQRDQYIDIFSIPYSKRTVIENAIEPAFEKTIKKSSPIKLIYHTTPHRGLELLYPVYEKLSRNMGDKVHLDVFSSFEIYGWKNRDERYAELFEKLKPHPHITYHGTQPNSVVREYLSQAHFFPYPCIWKETSCIALIEAIEHDVVAIHPNYGALPETAGQNTFMYQYTENHQDHANKMFMVLDALINGKVHTVAKMSQNPQHNVITFRNKWNNLLRQVINEKR